MVPSQRSFPHASVHNSSAADESQGQGQTLRQEIALTKLKGMGIHIDTLTEEQKKYLASWEMRT